MKLRGLCLEPTFDRQKLGDQGLPFGSVWPAHMPAATKFTRVGAMGTTQLPGVNNGRLHVSMLYLGRTRTSPQSSLAGHGSLPKIIGQTHYTGRNFYVNIATVVGNVLMIMTITIY